MNASPRKGKTGLYVSMVGDDPDTYSTGCAGIQVDTGDTRMIWSRTMLDAASEIGCLPAFALSRAGPMTRICFKFKVWMAGCRFPMQWFQLELAMCELDVDTFGQCRDVDVDGLRSPGRLPRMNSSKVESPWRVDGKRDAMDMSDVRTHIYTTPIMHDRAVFSITYGAFKYYRVDDGEVVHMLIHSISLEMESTAMFDRFVACSGHRVTCEIGDTYLYRANHIVDTYPVESPSPRVEVSRKRSGAKDSDEPAGGAPVSLSRRVYTWTARSDSAFPSVRDGRPPLNHEEESDMRVISPMQIVHKSGSRRSIRMQSRTPFVPDDPDYANTHFRLPYTFTSSQGDLRIRMFDFRVSPPVKFVVTIAWMDLDQEVVQTLPPSERAPPDTPTDEGARRASILKLVRRLSITKSIKKGAHVDRPSFVPAVQFTPVASDTGSVTKWVSRDVKLTVNYRARNAYDNAVDIEQVTLQVLNFEQTLNDETLWRH